MKILRLELENFMPYKGMHSIDFQTGANSQVVLFLGKNGHGKSSLLHAIRWCLYGATAVRKENKPNESLMNRDVIDAARLNADLKMGVTLVWENQGEEYSLTRRWWFDAVEHKPTSTTVLRIDGGNPISESQVQVTVKKFLPHDMSHLFLFDGESQREFDDMTSDSGAAAFIRGEIESTLSIPSLKAYGESIQRKLQAERKSVHESQKSDSKYEKLVAEVDQIQLNLESAREEVESIRSRIDTTRSEMEEAEDLLGDVSRFQDLKAQQDMWQNEEIAARNARDSLLEELRNLLQISFWLPAKNKLSEKEAETSVVAKEQGAFLDRKYSLRTEIERQKAHLTSNTCPTCGAETSVDESAILSKIAEFEEELREVENAINNAPASAGPALVKLGYSQNLASGGALKIKKLNEANAAISHAVIELVGVKNTLDALNVNGANTTDALDKYRIAQKTHDRAKIMLNDASTKHSNLLQELSAKQSELNKLTRTTPAKKVSLDCLTQVSMIFGEAIDKYIDQARMSVQNYATETFVGILGNHKWSGLEINENFGASPVLTRGSNDEMANTGTQKVTAISLVDGLIRTSMDGGFVLMDSPTGSLDDDNRDNFFKWAANSKMQVCLFMHDGEYDDKKHRASFGGKVGRVYEITLVSENESIVSAVKEIN